MQWRRRDLLRAAGVWSLGALLAGCAGSNGALATRSPASAAPTPAALPPDALVPLLTNSELVVGPNRFTLALLDAQNQPVTDARVRLEFFQVSGAQATKQGEAEATFRWVDDPKKGVYVARYTFSAAGPWGVQVTAQRARGAPRQARANFQVLEKSASPTIGSPAPRSKNPILSDVGGDASKLCTNAPPCDLHSLRIADALGAGKPSAILFATPGFCVSRTCAPQLGVVLQLRDRYREQASFIHIEIYKDPQNRVVADTVTEWGLQSEPWVFVVDRQGVVRDRLEGAAGLDELEASLKPLLA